MIITFRKRKMGKAFNDHRQLAKEYGQLAISIAMMMQTLRAAPTLEEVPATPPTRRHELVGDRKNTYAVTLKGNWRLVFEPAGPIPRDHEGGIDMSAITTIRILEVEDYH
jgi:plasmid maintenance system killer protein